MSDPLVLKAWDIDLAKERPDIVIAGSFLHKDQGCCWQVVPYVPGVQLDRSGYVFDAWRAEAAADFILRLREAAP